MQMLLCAFSFGNHLTITYRFGELAIWQRHLERKFNNSFALLFQILYLHYSDTSASGKFCEATNLSVSCKDMTGDSGEIKSEITVGFDVLLKNKEEGALHPSCEGRKYFISIHCSKTLANLGLM